MNKNPQNPSDSAPLASKKMPAIGSSVAIVAMVLVVLFMWRDMRNMKTAQMELTEQHTTLKAELTTAKIKLAAAKTELAEVIDELDFFKSKVPANLTGKQDSKKTTEPSLAEEPATLILQAPAVTSNSAGLVARLSFDPTPSASADLVALVVRLPADSDAVILGLGPTEETAYSNVKARVDASGKFAVFQGTPTSLAALQFDLTVSAPVKATIRGSKGIKAFELDISLDNPAVREL